MDEHELLSLVEVRSNENETQVARKKTNRQWPCRRSARDGRGSTLTDRGRPRDTEYP